MRAARLQKKINSDHVECKSEAPPVRDDVSCMVVDPPPLDAVDSSDDSDYDDDQSDTSADNESVSLKDESSVAAEASTAGIAATTN